MIRKNRSAEQAAEVIAPLVERERDAAARSRVVGQGIRIQKLDGDGHPVGDPVSMGGTASIDVEPLNREPSQLMSKTTGMIEFEAPLKLIDPEVVAALTRLPIPTAVIDRWFPAIVRWPGEPDPLYRCKVFLTPQGLYVYTAPPAEPETFTTGALPARYATIDFDKTRKPVVGSVARNAGIPFIAPAAGTIIVQPVAGCGCGSRIKHWTPSWARNSITWETAVRLAAEATEGR